MQKPRQFHGLTAFTCTYIEGGKRHSATLYGTDEAQVLSDNSPHFYGLTVEGILQEEIDDHDNQPPET